MGWWKRSVMRRWLARLSFSFLIIAAVLLWEANKLGSGGRSSAYIVGAFVCIALGIIGIRARHREKD
jgi:hypothetical protein